MACSLSRFGIAPSGAFFLIRDRFGIKPMYFARVGKTLLFGSEVKAILAHGALAPAIDFEALGEYLTFQNFFTSRTLFKNISLLPAGTVMEIAIDGSTQTRRYWDFRFSDDLNTPSAELIELTRPCARQSR